MHNAQSHRRFGYVQERQRPVPCRRVRAGLERENLHGDGAAVAGHARRPPELLVHHFGAADLLMQRRLSNDQVDVGPAFGFENGLLASQDRVRRPVARDVV